MNRHHGRATYCRKIHGRHPRWQQHFFRHRPNTIRHYPTRHQSSAARTHHFRPQSSMTLPGQWPSAARTHHCRHQSSIVQSSVPRQQVGAASYIRSSTTTTDPITTISQSRDHSNRASIPKPRAQVFNLLPEDALEQLHPIYTKGPSKREEDNHTGIYLALRKKTAGEAVQEIYVGKTETSLYKRLTQHTRDIFHGYQKLIIQNGPQKTEYHQKPKITKKARTTITKVQDVKTVHYHCGAQKPVIKFTSQKTIITGAWKTVTSYPKSLKPTFIHELLNTTIKTGSQETVIFHGSKKPDIHIKHLLTVPGFIHNPEDLQFCAFKFPKNSLLPMRFHEQDMINTLRKYPDLILMNKDEAMSSKKFDRSLARLKKYLHNSPHQSWEEIQLIKEMPDNFLV